MTSGKFFSFVAGILYTILALYLIFNPGANLLGLSYFLAFSVLMGGISELVFYFSLPSELRDGWQLFSGILTILAGLVLLSGGFVTLPVVIPTILGIWLTVFGITRLVRGFKLKSVTPNLSGAFLWVGGLGLVLGLIMLFHPVFASAFVGYLIAFGFLYQGVSLVLEAFKA